MLKYLIDLGFTDEEIKNILNIIIIDEEYNELKEIINLFYSLGISLDETREMINVNPLIINGFYEDILELITLLKKHGIDDIKHIFIMNPCFINKTIYDVEKFYKKHSDEKEFEINNMILDNPFILDDI